MWGPGISISIKSDKKYPQVPSVRASAPTSIPLNVELERVLITIMIYLITIYMLAMITTDYTFQTFQNRWHTISLGVFCVKYEYTLVKEVTVCMLSLSLWAHQAVMLAFEFSLNWSSCLSKAIPFWHLISWLRLSLFKTILSTSKAPLRGDASLYPDQTSTDSFPHLASAKNAPVFPFWGVWSSCSQVLILIHG